MPEPSFYLKDNQAKKSTQIYLSLYCDDDRLRVSTGVKLDPKFWRDNWFSEVGKNKDAITARSSIDTIKTRVAKHILNCELNNLPLLARDVRKLIIRKEQKNVVATKPEVGFFSIYDTMLTDIKSGKIKNKHGKRYSPEVLRPWRLNKRLLEDYAAAMEVNLEPARLTEDTVKGFVTWMNNRKKAALNYVSKQVSLWRTTVNILQTEYKYHNSSITKTGCFTAPTEEADKIKLSEAHVAELYHHNLTGSSYLQAVRDRWIVMYCTGLRVSDNRRLTLDHFGKENIVMINNKTSKKVVIPYHWMLEEILKRYNGSLPPNYTAEVINREIKQICKAVGLTEYHTYRITRNGKTVEERKRIWELVTNHTGRRSLVSSMIKNKIPYSLGGDIVGMSPKTWEKYNKLSAEEKADVVRHFPVFKKRIAKGDG